MGGARRPASRYPGPAPVGTGTGRQGSPRGSWPWQELQVGASRAWLLSSRCTDAQERGPDGLIWQRPRFLRPTKQPPTTSPTHAACYCCCGLWSVKKTRVLLWTAILGNVSNPHKLHFYIGEYGRSKLHHLLSNSSPFSATKNKNKPHRKKGARVPLALGTSFGDFQNPELRVTEHCKLLFQPTTLQTSITPCISQNNGTNGKLGSCQFSHK